jgi:hypothetical protein
MTYGVTGAPPEKPKAISEDQHSRTISKRVLWDWALVFVGFIYVSVVLFGHWYSTVFSVLLIIFTGYEVIEPRWGRS